MNDTIAIISAIVICIAAYIGITVSIIAGEKTFNFSFLSPSRNYTKWKKMNWFGVAIITWLLNIIWLPYAIIYWLYKSIYWLFTVGRKSN